MAKRQIPQRRRIFVGCEGQSEQSYVRLLQTYSILPVHLDPVLLQPGGGDAGALLERAKARHAQGQQRNGRYDAAFVFLDKDKLGNNTMPDLERRAQRIGIVLIWQDPCHEAFLLRHFPGCQNRIPANGAEAMNALQRIFESYDKATPARILETQISLEMIRQAASVTAGLTALLGLIAPP